jgi:hypothetical protein
MMSNENNELTPNLDEQAAIEIIRKHRKSGKSFDLDEKGEKWLAAGRLH